MHSLPARAPDDVVIGLDSDPSSHPSSQYPASWSSYHNFGFGGDGRPPLMSAWQAGVHAINSLRSQALSDAPPTPLGSGHRTPSSYFSAALHHSSAMTVGATGPPLRALVTVIDRAALRGVPATLLVQGFGKAFADHRTAQENYSKSYEVQGLDDFVSHDWASSRRAKFLSLCVLYNGQPAAVGSTALAVALSACQLYWEMPVPSPPDDSITSHYGCWCQLLCPPIFFLLLLYWQQLRRRICGWSREVFLDKYCIDQTNDTRKEAGILGMAGFLRSTQRMVILWTPRYFTRLWCTYEVATWLYLQKPLDSLIFLPLALGKAIVAINLLATALLLFYGTAMAIFGGGAHTTLAAVVIAVAVPLPAHGLRRFMPDLRKLPQQLRTFSLKRADHSTSDEPDRQLPCDRVLVERAVGTWFGGGGAGNEGEMGHVNSLAYFDKQVRELFGQFVAERAGPSNPPYQFSFLLAFPLVFRSFDALRALRAAPSESVAMAALEPLALALVIVPCMNRVAFSAAAWMDRLGFVSKTCILDLLYTAILVVIIECGFFVLCAAMTTANSHYGTGPFALVLVLESLLCLFLYRRDVRRLWRSCRCRGVQAQAPESAQKETSPESANIDEITISTHGDRVSRVRRVLL